MNRSSTDSPRANYVCRILKEGKVQALYFFKKQQFSNKKIDGIFRGTDTAQNIFSKKPQEGMELSKGTVADPFALLHHMPMI